VAIQGSKISVSANGDDDQACLDALDALAGNRFGEKD